MPSRHTSEASNWNVEDWARIYHSLTNQEERDKAARIVAIQARNAERMSDAGL